MLSIAASVVVWPRCLPTLAIRSQHREGAGQSLLEVGQKAIFLANRYTLCASQAVGNDTKQHAGNNR
jgi:hypothetical protein